MQTSQGQFGVKSEIFGEHSSPVLGGVPLRNFWNFGAKWCNLTHFEDIYPRLYQPVFHQDWAANWIYSPTVECVWFTNRCVRAWHDRWMREPHAQCVRLVRSEYEPSIRVFPNRRNISRSWSDYTCQITGVPPEWWDWCVICHGWLITVWRHITVWITAVFINLLK